MKQFARLFDEIDQTTRTSEKVDALVQYFTSADPADAAWAVWFLSGNRPKRLVPVRRLSAWAMELAAVPDWLFEQSYEVVGDLAETISLLLSEGPGGGERRLHDWVENVLLRIPTLPEPQQRELLVRSWNALRGTERFVWNKLITGGFRVGVSKQLVVRAIARSAGVDEGTIAHRLSGAWSPSASAYAALVAKDTADADRSRPYPFYLAYPLESELDELGDVRAWQIEWKWDGIRAQLIRRDGQTYIWSRGDELVTDRLPELHAVAESLPDGTVLDGEIVPWKAGSVLPFGQLQRRIGRTSLGPKILADVPVRFIAYDVLEEAGADIRGAPLGERRERLEGITTASHAAIAASSGSPLPGATAIMLSPVVPLTSWEDVRAAQAVSRKRGAEGLMLKRRDSTYGVGRRKGGWWKWKVQPYSLDAVMIYAQAGHGRRASLHTDYTFGLWDDGALVPFAKAYTGLTDAEIRELDAWIRRNTLEKFGPVRRVEPVHVFEIGFEAIQRSTHHKAGVAVRFPRILRWRNDKSAGEADTLDALRKLLEHG